MESENASGGPAIANMSTANPAMPYDICEIGTACQLDRICNLIKPSRYTTAMKTTSMNCEPDRLQAVKKSPMLSAIWNEEFTL